MVKQIGIAMSNQLGSATHRQEDAREKKLIIIIGATTCATLCYWCCGARKLTVFIAVDYGSFLLAAL